MSKGNLKLLKASAPSNINPKELLQFLAENDKDPKNCTVTAITVEFNSDTLSTEAVLGVLYAAHKIYPVSRYLSGFGQVVWRKRKTPPRKWSAQYIEEKARRRKYRKPKQLTGGDFYDQSAPLPEGRKGRTHPVVGFKDPYE